MLSFLLLDGNNYSNYTYVNKSFSKTRLPELARRFVEDAYLCIYIVNNTK